MLSLNCKNHKSILCPVARKKGSEQMEALEGNVERGKSPRKLIELITEVGSSG